MWMVPSDGSVLFTTGDTLKTLQPLLREEDWRDLETPNPRENILLVIRQLFYQSHLRMPVPTDTVNLDVDFGDDAVPETIAYRIWNYRAEEIHQIYPTIPGHLYMGISAWAIYCNDKPIAIASHALLRGRRA